MWTILFQWSSEMASQIKRMLCCCCRRRLQLSKVLLFKNAASKFNACEVTSMWENSVKSAHSQTQTCTNKKLEEIRESSGDSQSPPQTQHETKLSLSLSLSPRASIPQRTTSNRNEGGETHGVPVCVCALSQPSRTERERSSFTRIYYAFWKRVQPCYAATYHTLDTPPGRRRRRKRNALVSSCVCYCHGCSFFFFLRLTDIYIYKLFTWCSKSDTHTHIHTQTHM